MVTVWAAAGSAAVSCSTSRPPDIVEALAGIPATGDNGVPKIKLGGNDTVMRIPEIYAVGVVNPTMILRFDDATRSAAAIVSVGLVIFPPQDGVGEPLL